MRVAIRSVGHGEGAARVLDNDDDLGVGKRGGFFCPLTGQLAVMLGRQEAKGCRFEFRAAIEGLLVDWAVSWDGRRGQMRCWPRSHGDDDPVGRKVIDDTDAHI